MRLICIYLSALSIGHAFLLTSKVPYCIPTSLFVRPEDFAAGRIQPALPFRGTPEEEEKRRQAEIRKEEAEAIEQKRAGRLKAARRDAEEEFYEEKYAVEYQRKMEAASREAQEAQLKLEEEQTLLQEKRRQLIQQEQSINNAMVSQEKAERKQQSLLSDLEEVRQRREGYRREKVNRADERKGDLPTQEMNAKSHENRFIETSVVNSESITSTTTKRVAKSNLPLFSLPATAILGGLLALRSRDQTQKEVEQLLQLILVQRSNEILGKAKNQKEAEKAFEDKLLQRKKEITDYGNLALVCPSARCIQSDFSWN